MKYTVSRCQEIFLYDPPFCLKKNFFTSRRDCGVLYGPDRDENRWLLRDNSYSMCTSFLQSLQPAPFSFSPEAQVPTPLFSSIKVSTVFEFHIAVYGFHVKALLIINFGFLLLICLLSIYSQIIKLSKGKE